MNDGIRFTTDLTAVDWPTLKATLADDRFDNGRTPEQLRVSFENSQVRVLAIAEERIVGTARALSDGVCNAYVVDVWTYSPFRRQGIATRMMRMLLERLTGQHVYLFTDDVQEFYRSLGFIDQPTGLGKVVGTWLKDE